MMILSENMAEAGGYIYWGEGRISVPRVPRDIEDSHGGHG